MGQEAEAEARRAAFAGYEVDEALMAAAPPDAVVLHCLPAHRGEEISAAVVDGPAERGLAAGGQPDARHAGTAGLGARDARHGRGAPAGARVRP